VTEAEKIEQQFRDAIDQAFELGRLTDERTAPFTSAVLIRAWKLGKKMGVRRKEP
jgi:hypothetical protein